MLHLPYPVADRYTAGCCHGLQHLELGSYMEWDEARRLEFLLSELRGKRPLFPPGMDMTPDVREVVDTFRWAHLLLLPL